MEPLLNQLKELTRKFLDFNNPEKNPKAFLRQPQFEALETYVFLKEFLGNAKVEEIFKAKSSDVPDVLAALALALVAARLVAIADAPFP